MKTGIFNPDFFPTPVEVIEKMLFNQPLNGKIVLEPSAGKGDIVDYLQQYGAETIACESSPDLCEILKNKCNIISRDFLQVKDHQVSHIDLIIMNPPFSADENHILHAWEIAPEACKIIALCNSKTLSNRNYRQRRELGEIIDQYGYSEELGKVFQTAERQTDVEVSMIVIQKPGENNKNEFEGFFLDDDPAEPNTVGIMPYNLVRDLVNRYINAVKLFDQQLEFGVQMQQLTSIFYGTPDIAFSCTLDKVPITRNNFKKALQKNAWKYIFSELKMDQYATSGLKSDINKFVEQQTQIPFTMRNIYRMIDIVIGTQSQRMDKALLEVFEKVTKHYDENRWNLEGWKTNSHYLVNRKFILPHVVSMGFNGHLRTGYYGWADAVNDLHKALHFLTGEKYEGCYDDFGSFLDKNRVKAGELHTWKFFEFRAYKKGTVHFTFKDENLWALFNQQIARILGYPLPEEIKPKTSRNTQPEPINTQPEPLQPIDPITEEPKMVEFSDESEHETENQEVVYNPDQLSMF